MPRPPQRSAAAAASRPPPARKLGGTTLRARSRIRAEHLPRSAPPCAAARRAVYLRVPPAPPGPALLLAAAPGGGQRGSDPAGGWGGRGRPVRPSAPPQRCGGARPCGGCPARLSRGAAGPSAAFPHGAQKRRRDCKLFFLFFFFFFYTGLISAPALQPPEAHSRSSARTAARGCAPLGVGPLRADRSAAARLRRRAVSEPTRCPTVGGKSAHTLWAASADADCLFTFFPPTEP